MVQKKSPVAVKTPAPKEEIKETTVVNKSVEVKPPAPNKVKATEPKVLSPIDKWNTVKVLLMQKFPIFQTGELDIVNCTIDDRKVHVRTKLRMTDKEIAAIIPGY
jgi:hypothetical protein